MKDAQIEGLTAKDPAEGVRDVEDFDPHVGKTVRFSGADIVLTLDHILCDRGRILPSYVQRRPFILIFRGARSRDPQFRDVLPEGLYTCAFDDGPSYDIYVAPIHTPELDRQNYQAVFN